MAGSTSKSKKDEETPAVAETEAAQVESIESTTIESNPVDGRADLGTAPGTDQHPRTKGLPEPESSTVGSGYRFAEKVGATVAPHTTDDGKTLTWTDPDAVPGTVGDDPGETMEALAGAGAAAVKVEESSDSKK
jgi:hypothetical protein